MTFGFLKCRLLIKADLFLPYVLDGFTTSYACLSLYLNITGPEHSKTSNHE